MLPKLDGIADAKRLIDGRGRGDLPASACKNIQIAQK